MSTFSAKLTPAAEKALTKLDRKDQLRITAAIELLCENPLPPKSIKLTGRDGYRIRVGKFRVLYAFNGKTLVILIIDIGHRKDIYLR